MLGQVQKRFATIAVVATVITRTMSAGDTNSVAAEAKRFLEFYNVAYQRLYTVAQEAGWAASTDATPENVGRRIGAEHAKAAFTGDRWVIEKARTLLQHTNVLDELTVRQLQMVWLHAAEAPGTIPDVVAARVAAEAKQRATLDSFVFKWVRPGATASEPITPNQIDQVLIESTNLAERLAAWKASKDVGCALKPGLLELRELRNRVAREMGFSSFFALQVARFGMSAEEMRALTEALVNQTRPLYEQLHCWARHRLAERYGQPVPRLIPAHWLPNRWGQEWPGLVQGLDLDKWFATKSPEWIVRQAVAYGESLGLPKVPPSFWDKSDLYELPPDAPRKKNTHASAWDINLEGDVRSLMSVKPNARWFATAHHELGHIFYQLSYCHAGIPPLLRDGASPAFHEAMAETLAAPTMQLPYLKYLGILPEDASFDPIQWLLQNALEEIVFIPWSAGVMTAWEYDFYENNLAAEELNKRWWKYVEDFQGIAPPEPRPEVYCDAATKTHINDDPAQYYKYAIAFVIKYQLHMHIAKKLLRQDPYNCNYYGNKEVGAFLYNLMKVGATRDWRALVREATGEDLSAKAMLEFYAPLMDYLRAQNAGRQPGW
ncbi:MAG: M2 family metallopeptidase [Verrucomicrobiae bacterium]|nr:M2 family metallopeptidase [Verrucomicrobiae bacterium]